MLPTFPSCHIGAGSAIAILWRELLLLLMSGRQACAELKDCLFGVRRASFLDVRLNYRE